MVDHECVGNESISVDLSNYKLINIEEGNNEYSLKESNLGYFNRRNKRNS